MGVLVDLEGQYGVPVGALEALQHDSSPRRCAEVIAKVIAEDRAARTDREDLEEAREMLRAHLRQLMSLLLPDGPVVGETMRAEVLDAAAAYQRGIVAIDKVLG